MLLNAGMHLPTVSAFLKDCNLLTTYAFPLYLLSGGVKGLVEVDGPK